MFFGYGVGKGKTGEHPTIQDGRSTGISGGNVPRQIATQVA